MPAVPRLITVTYGSTSIGGSTERQPHGQYRQRIDYGTYVLEVPFVVTGGMPGIITTLETEFRKIREVLTIVFDGNTVVFDESVGSGYNARATLIKPADERDTREQRLYVAVFEVDLPADFTGQLGRVDAIEQIIFSESRRRTLVLSGTWTQIVGTASAKANYDTNKIAYQAAAITAIISSARAAACQRSSAYQRGRSVPTPRARSDRRKVVSAVWAASGAGVNRLTVTRIAAAKANMTSAM